MLRAVATLALWAILGTLAGCVLPAAAYIVGHHFFPRPAPWGIGIAVLVLLIVFAISGLITGLIGGIIYCTGQRFGTAASVCLGTVMGGTVAVVPGLQWIVAPDLHSAEPV